MARKTQSRTSQPFEVRASPIQGMGGFATRHIEQGERIVEYAGERITSEESDRRYIDEEMERHHTFLFIVDDETVVDAGVDGNDARFINHSCDPNAEAVIEDRRIWIYALRDIAEGEEIFYDYAYELDDAYTPDVLARYPCHCGAANCRGTILAPKPEPRKRRKAVKRGR